MVYKTNSPHTVFYSHDETKFKTTHTQAKTTTTNQ